MWRKFLTAFKASHPSAFSAFSAFSDFPHFPNFPCFPRVRAADLLRPLFSVRERVNPDFPHFPRFA